MQTAEVSAALASALQRHTGQAGEVLALQRLTGGATKETWAFDWQVSNSNGQREPLILQRWPAAEPVRRDQGDSGASDQRAKRSPMYRLPKLDAAQEAALMTAARSAGVPAPVVRWVLQPADGLGDACITERVEGETMGRRIVQDDTHAAARPQMASQCGKALAAIHRMPTDSLPFLARMSPADELQVYGDLLAMQAVRHPALAYALRWVQQHLPTDWQPRVVHADFRTGNLIVGPDGLRCVLDWEIARIGDPMQDLGVLCMRTWRFGGTGEVGGFGRREDLYAAYEAAGGGPVDPERVRFWEAFSNLKWAIACVRRGQSRRADGSPASVELCAVGRRLEEPLWDFLTLTTAPAAGA